MARIQPPRASSGTKSPACFFTIFAAFFSFGDSRGCFLASLLVFFSLDIRSSPGSDRIFGRSGQRRTRSFLQRPSVRANHVRRECSRFYRAARRKTPVRLPCPTLSYRRVPRPCLLRIPVPYVPSRDRFLPAALECSLCLCQKNKCAGRRLMNLKYFFRPFQFGS